MPHLHKALSLAVMLNDYNLLMLNKIIYFFYEIINNQKNIGK